jgi:hypothetical protein
VCAGLARPCVGRVRSPALAGFAQSEAAGGVGTRDVRAADPQIRTRELDVAEAGGTETPGTETPGSETRDAETPGSETRDAETSGDCWKCVRHGRTPRHGLPGFPR